MFIEIVRGAVHEPGQFGVGAVSCVHDGGLTGAFLGEAWGAAASSRRASTRRVFSTSAGGSRRGLPWL